MGFYYSLRFQCRKKTLMLSWSVSLGYGNGRVYNSDTVWEIVDEIFFYEFAYSFSFACTKNVIHMSMFWYMRTKNLHCHFCLNCPPVADSFCSLISICQLWVFLLNFFLSKMAFFLHSLSSKAQLPFIILCTLHTSNLSPCINDDIPLWFLRCLNTVWPENSKMKPWNLCRQTKNTPSNFDWRQTWDTA
jgi:hypothetical protein